MRTIKEIYDFYKIPLNLQEHQIRVAAVVSWILDHWKGEPLNKKRIILAALFHDMGNIIKFDFSQTVALFPALYSESDIPKLEQIKKEFIEKYGTDPHHAGALIVEEIGNPNNIKNILSGIGFRNAPIFLETMDYESMIVQYADMRVSPHEIQSVESRLEDFYARYKHRPDFDEKYPQREKSKEAVLEIEKILIANTSQDLLSITEETVSMYYKKLKNLTIE